MKTTKARKSRKTKPKHKTPAANTAPIPIHQWTHDGKRVLLVKCVSPDGLSYDNFRWPQSGPVRPTACTREPTCESGGLFGWPWGLILGGGKDCDYDGKWIVFSAPPAQVVMVGTDKAKVCADTAAKVDCRVEFYGDWWSALAFTEVGRSAWIFHAASGAASNSGASGAASNSGDRGAASNSGDRGAASNSGDRGIAATTGEYSTVNGGETGLAASTAERFYWIARDGAVLAYRFEKISGLLDATEMGLAGKTVKIFRGQIVVEWPD